MESLWERYVANGRRHGLYSAAGEPYVGSAELPESSVAPWLTGTPTLRFRPAQRMDGHDGIVQVPAAAGRELVEELVWTARDFETEARARHRWVADVLYAAIARGILPRIPALEVELVAGRLLAHLSPADLVDHAAGARRLLGMPAARWGDRDYDDAIRGRRLARRI